jgi:hypothetical protein
MQVNESSTKNHKKVDSLTFSPEEKKKWINNNGGVDKNVLNMKPKLKLSL